LSLISTETSYNWPLSLFLVSEKRAIKIPHRPEPYDSNKDQSK